MTLEDVSGLFYEKGQRINDLLLENQTTTQEALQQKLAQLIENRKVTSYKCGEEIYFILPA